MDLRFKIRQAQKYMLCDTIYMRFQKKGNIIYSDKKQIRVAGVGVQNGLTVKGYMENFGGDENVL